MSLSNENQFSEISYGIILAAGMGKRMKSSLPKVAHTILGKPMVLWAVESFLSAGMKHVVAVVSEKQPAVIRILEESEHYKSGKLTYVFQEVALGTGNAALCGVAALRKIKNFHSDSQIAIGFGDTPALQSKSLEGFLNFHFQEKNTATIMAFETQNPFGYGRVIQTPHTNQKPKFTEIREEKDCNEAQKSISLVNSGFLVAHFEALESKLPHLKNNNASQEYYLTDVPKMLASEGLAVGVFDKVEENELLGVNSQQQLAALAKQIQKRVVEKFLDQGVQILNPDCVYLEPTIQFGSECIVEPFVFLSGNKEFKSGTRITSFTRC